MRPETSPRAETLLLSSRPQALVLRQAQDEGDLKGRGLSLEILILSLSKDEDFAPCRRALHG